MNNNKPASLDAFMIVCGEEREWESEVGHFCVQHAVGSCHGILHAFVCLLHMVRYYRHHVPYWEKARMAWVLYWNIDLAYILTPTDYRPLAFVASMLAGLSTCQIACSAGLVMGCTVDSQLLMGSHAIGCLYLGRQNWNKSPQPNHQHHLRG